ncbi:MAG: Glu/Leu/Phe/Val dehydrogenase [Candidatus Marinimicrobia bacterium]|nr:Glu/Leu/Phe/Val dehydrogenase [Candidatus Neomarinimicrobiota bacterium]MCH7763132.1 Glu/Leu/Phe/Val dehydrogenase [Candidatus Neomarinimicrobiota bacterium]
MESVFDEMNFRDHEQVVFCNDPDTGLKSIIAIHNTTIGPALGGCRMWNYNSEKDALKDVLRLSRSMSYKAAIANLNLGGGKAVIMGDSKRDKSEILFRSFGRFVQGLGGRYITAEDVGTSVKDMEWVRMETQYVTGISRALGGSGDPSPVTAFGTFMGMKAAVKKQLGKDSLSGLKVSIQGVGHVGYHLCKYLHQENVEIFATDIDQQSLIKVSKDFNATVVNPDEIYDLDVDIYAPCALGATINNETIPKIKAFVIAGAANNQLEDESKHGQQLKQKGILYAPDYAINAGGLINVANEIDGYNRERAFNQAEGIYETLMTIFATADEENIPTNEAAEKVAINRMKEVSKLRNVFLPRQNPMRKRDN